MPPRLRRAAHSPAAREITADARRLATQLAAHRSPPSRPALQRRLGRRATPARHSRSHRNSAARTRPRAGGHRRHVGVQQRVHRITKPAHIVRRGSAGPPSPATSGSDPPVETTTGRRTPWLRARADRSPRPGKAARACGRRRTAPAACARPRSRATAPGRPGAARGPRPATVDLPGHAPGDDQRRRIRAPGGQLRVGLQQDADVLARVQGPEEEDVPRNAVAGGDAPSPRPSAVRLAGRDGCVTRAPRACRATSAGGVARGHDDGVGRAACARTSLGKSRRISAVIRSGMAEEVQIVNGQDRPGGAAGNGERGGRVHDVGRAGQPLDRREAATGSTPRSAPCRGCGGRRPGPQFAAGPAASRSFHEAREQGDAARLAGPPGAVRARANSCTNSPTPVRARRAGR